MRSASLTLRPQWLIAVTGFRRRGSIRATQPCERHEMQASIVAATVLAVAGCVSTTDAYARHARGGERPASETVTIATSRAPLQATPTGQKQ